MMFFLRYFDYLIYKVFFGYLSGSFIYEVFYIFFVIEFEISEDKF